MSGANGPNPGDRAHLAGERERQIGPPVEAVLEGDDAGAFRRGARDLDRVLDRLGAAIDQQRLLGKLPGVISVRRRASST